MPLRSSTSSSKPFGRSPWGFLLRAGLFALLPLALATAAYIYFDPFKVVHWHDEPFADSLGINKGQLSVQSFERYNPSEHFDSFILGSSVSCYYDADEWRRYLPDSARVTHLDSSTQIPTTLALFVEYLERQKVPLRHAMVVLAPDVLSFTYDPERLPSLNPPAVVRNPLYALQFHYKYLCGFLNYRYLEPYAIWRATGERIETTGAHVFNCQPVEYTRIINEERIPAWDRLIEADVEEFYRRYPTRGFLPEDEPYHPLPREITPEYRDALRRVAAVFSRQHTDYKVILGPTPALYVLNPEQQRFMRDTFGDHFVDLTREFRAEQSDSTNFYDRIHYRPTLARRYLRRAYSPR